MTTPPSVQTVPPSVQTPPAVLPSIEDRIAAELGVKPWQVRAAVDLLDGGSTVPFVARYRKEVTGTLDDTQLRTLEERLGYLRELEERRSAVLASIESQGKLDDALAAQIRAAETKSRLEDIYLPYKPKRRTKAQIAREAGLEPLADLLLNDPSTTPAAAALGFVNREHGVDDAAAALAGARAILVERFAEDADLVGELRERLWSRGRLGSAVRAGKEEEGAKFKDYFAFSEPLTTLPSHRILAMFRGEKEDVLSLTFATGEDEEDGTGPSSYESSIAQRFGIAERGHPADAWLAETVGWAWRTRVAMHLELDLRSRLWQIAEDEALRVFSHNLRDLLLAAPAGTRSTMGLDPGLRTGVKVAVVDATGKVVATDTIYPHPPARKWDAALATLAGLATAHGVELIAIGNGTASRETDKLAGELITQLSVAGTDSKTPIKAVVSEAGASVYSASAYASAELPELDVSLRGAVSIARRLQDPLAELVKIDPKSIGVGQYQHDLAGSRLSRSLDAVVEDCVNAVGVDLNTASAPLLRRVSGVTEGLASAIVAHRDSNGPFRKRDALKDVPRLGPKAFEQCAGFLRIADGDDPLDRSAVHPEAYPVVRRILTATDRDARGLIGDAAALRALKAADFVDDLFGLPTVTDIIAELEKPGRDPRPAFTAARFADGVEKIADLVPGMVLEGVVTNVAGFGAFVDVGVHQDGLVHVSAMSKTFVKDPREVVKPGDVVKVKVVDVDVPRKRIGLTLRLTDDSSAAPPSARSKPPRPAQNRSDHQRPAQKDPAQKDPAQKASDQNGPVQAREDRKPDQKRPPRRRRGAAQGKPAGGTPSQTNPAQGQPAQQQPSEGTPAQPVEGQARPSQPAPTRERPIRERPTRERPARERPARGRPAQGNPAQGNPAQERPAQERPARDRTTQGKPAPGNPAKGNPAKGNPARPNPRRSEPSGAVADAFRRAGWKV